MRLTPVDNAGQILIINTFLAWFLTNVGDFAGAEAAISEARARVPETYDWTSGREWGPVTRAEVPNHEGQILLGQGRYEEAEAKLREAIGIVEKDIARGGNSASLNSAGQPLGEVRLRSKSTFEVRLSLALSGQDRLAEAESHARSALKSYLRNFGRHSDRAAFALSALVQILTAQGRFEEAEQLARARVEIFEQMGAGSNSLTLAKAQDILGDSLMGQSRWSEALAEFEKIERVFAGDAATFNRTFARNPNRGLAYLKAGRNQDALRVAEEAADGTAFVLGEDHYESAEARGILAMAYVASGQTDQAFDAFGASIPILLQRSRASDSRTGMATTRDQRLRLIINAYVELLVELIGTDAEAARGIDAGAEAFRVAEVARSRLVQQALISSGARAALPDPELSDLARREQDAQKRIAALYGLLADNPSGSAATNLRGAIDRLRGARAALIEEIEARFPAYADLINPNPASIEDARAALVNVPSGRAATHFRGLHPA